MNEIKKYEGLPVLPDILAKAMPIQVPQMKWENSIPSNFFHNLKLKQFDRASEFEANIAENKCRAVTAYFEMMKHVINFSSELNLQQREYEHRIKMMELEQYREGQLAQQETWKTKTMEVEFLTAQLTFKKMQQEVDGENSS
jgi:hypothetical protein